MVTATPHAPNRREVFTTGQVAKLCHVAPRTVSKWFDAGELKGFRIPLSQDRRIPRASLVAFLKRNDMPLGELAEPGLLLVGLTGPALDAAALVARRLGLEPVAAGDAFGAAVAVAGRAADAAVIDFAVGRAEALAIAQGLRSTRPEVLLVAIAVEDDASDLTQHGFAHMLRKPFSPAELERAVAPKSIAS